MQRFDRKTALIVGLGRSGQAALHFLLREGATVIATDVRGSEYFSDLREDCAAKPVEFVFGEHPLDLVQRCDIAVMSPGVSEKLPLVRALRDRNVPITSELDLALEHISNPVIAITGTNGKTTTTHLVAHLLKSGGISHVMAGNVGVPLLECIDGLDPKSWVVLEVSSFQLMQCRNLRPQISVLLNITPDHLDRHASLQQYAETKAQVFVQLKRGGVAIFNEADPWVCRVVDRIPPHALLQPFSGTSDQENILASRLVARAVGIEEETLQRGLASFVPLPHRLQIIGEWNGVRYIDDSKGTNVGATRMALAAQDRPVVLIAGGLAKGADLGELSDIVSAKARCVIAIGDAAEEINAKWGKNVPITRAGSMLDAVRLAEASAQRGDVVLLSPACASQDMFRDYIDRGEQFATAVRTIVAEKNNGAAA